jgi:phenylpyruvate tautomerase PptA (4-oxalocrotonate tautomerase family)
MPVVKLEIVEAPDWTRPRDLAQRVADAMAGVLAAAPESVWVRVSTIPAADYAENGGPPGAAAPIFITILERDPPQGAALAAEVAALTNALAFACGRPESDIHLIYEPPGRGRVAFGGRLVT